MQFRLWQLGVGVALLCAALAVLAITCRQARTVASIKAMGGSVIYDFEYVHHDNDVPFSGRFDRYDGTPWEGDFLMSLWGPDLFHSVSAVELPPHKNLEAIPLVRSLVRVRRVRLGAGWMSWELMEALTTISTLEEVQLTACSFDRFPRDFFLEQMEVRGISWQN